MFRGQEIPKIWYQSAMVMIPNKGDMTNIKNLWGISFMRLVLEVTVYWTVEKAMKASGLFILAQAGFRKSEELITRVDFLLELFKCHLLGRLATYLTLHTPGKLVTQRLKGTNGQGTLFWVPRSRTGVSQELHARSTIAVRCGGEILSPVPFKYGVCQGSPLRRPSLMCSSTTY